MKSFFGVDYYPEHWPIEMMDSDMDRLVDLGVEVVRIGEFAWHIMEKREGEYDFSFFDMVIEKLKKRGIKVIFGTPTATPPAWLINKYPEILQRDENLMPRSFGGRRMYCYNNEVYREYTRKIVTKLAEHYKNEDSIIAWQIDNEFGHEGSDICFCDTCKEGFRKFLKDKYEEIENLNKTWGTVFWSQTYNSFDEIPLPLKTITHHNPSMQLDYRRFMSKSINEYAKLQVDILREVLGNNAVITTNIAGGYFDKNFDHKEMVKHMDFASYDNYPVWGGLKEPITPANIAMDLDFIRGLKRKNFWIVEELMGAQGHTIIGYLPRPNQAKMWAYQAVAHGAQSILFFRYRTATFGTEEFCLGIIDQDNREGRKYKEVKEFFSDVKKYKDLLQSPIKSEIAFLYDYDNIWAWKIQPQSTAFNFKEEMLKIYTAFYKYNTHIDVIDAKDDFSEYKVVVLPVMMIVDENLKNKLEEFTKKGGIVVLTYRTSIKDRNNNLYLGKTMPCNLNQLTGIEVEEIESLQEGQFAYADGKYGRTKCCVMREMINSKGAEVIYTYEDKFYKNKACITVNKFGEGKVYYIGSSVDSDVLSSLAKEIIMEKSIEHFETPFGVEVYSRYYGDKKYLFIMNHTEEEHDVLGIKLMPYDSRIIEVK
ncbi:beta-galactosidase [Thermobrachium celere]|uniref:beta-galactosidase n=1 Tax=Thermobrachium celere TaxID=53422 RepID=UPI0019407100|nr:beta-galactosidase [Thermobrachium celere]GFR34860.1 beta-galactosidase [Thermobrachium celere]